MKYSLDRELPAGSTAVLVLKFTRQLNKKMVGFYIVSPMEMDGAQAYLTTSLMAPISARQAFPCFDEPALKARFTITLIADADFTCLSNMDVDSETPTGRKKSVKFRQTPCMSTYLVAFTVGKLQYIEEKSGSLPIRLYAQSYLDIKRGQFALDTAAQMVTHYEQVLNIKFPLPKLVSTCRILKCGIAKRSM